MKETDRRIVVDEEFVHQEEKHFTVSKTSLFFANDGFTVYDCSSGELVFRVDSYGPDARDRDELVLMDAHGRCLLTVRKKFDGAFAMGLVLVLDQICGGDLAEDDGDGAVGVVHVGHEEEVDSGPLVVDSKAMDR
ncbi:unnamed protein product [Linum tenue]|uniref:Uncharacterized protein n=1 Tax=Linum tenue TaxID=586396 RepID=A0AAV0LTC3_9ROSI|nr:unnamed protein product [Linum tenue]